MSLDRKEAIKFVQLRKRQKYDLLPLICQQFTDVAGIQLCYFDVKIGKRVYCKIIVSGLPIKTYLTKFNLIWYNMIQ